MLDLQHSCLSSQRQWHYITCSLTKRCCCFDFSLIICFLYKDDRWCLENISFIFSVVQGDILDSRREEGNLLQISSFLGIFLTYGWQFILRLRSMTVLIICLSLLKKMVSPHQKCTFSLVDKWVSVSQAKISLFKGTYCQIRNKKLVLRENKDIQQHNFIAKKSFW